jgi:hypothetical protein
MTPAEKAIELLDKMSSRTYQYQEYAGARYTTCEVGYEAGKQCALIAIKIFESSLTENDIKDYWSRVKEELDKL